MTHAPVTTTAAPAGASSAKFHRIVTPMNKLESAKSDPLRANVQICPISRYAAATNATTAALAGRPKLFNPLSTMGRAAKNSTLPQSEIGSVILQDNQRRTESPKKVLSALAHQSPGHRYLQSLLESDQSNPCHTA